MKKGQKIKVNLRNQCITIQLMQEEKEKILNKAKLENKSISDYCRDLLIQELKRNMIWIK